MDNKDSISKLPNKLTSFRDTFLTALGRVVPLRPGRMLTCIVSGKEFLSISLPLVDLVTHSERVEIAVVIFIRGMLTRKRALPSCISIILKRYFTKVMTQTMSVL